jgi:hypothetical protein
MITFFRQLTWAVAAIVAISSSAQLARGEGYCEALELCCWPSWCYGCCQDNYCAKPSPSMPCLGWNCCCDPYCAKPMPCVPCVGGGSCYCYRPKPLPPVRLDCDPTYKCGPCCAPALDAAKQP